MRQRMQTENAYVLRAYPDEKQKARIRNTIGASRFVYNLFLSIRRYTDEKIRNLGWNLSASDRRWLYQKMLTELKKLPMLKWLNEADSMALQASLDDLDRAFVNFRQGRARHPKYKSKHRSRLSCRTKSQAVRAKKGVKRRRGKKKMTICIDGGRIKIPKVGWVKVRLSQKLRGRIVSATLEETPAGDFRIIVNAVDVQFAAYPKTGRKVGVDLGLKDLAITSDGVKYKSNRSLEKNLAKLKHLQKLLPRKPKGSKQYEKLRKKIAKLHETIRNQRRDGQHKLTHELTRDCDVICIETLSPKNMMKNHRLARAIQDAGWGEIVRQLEYKSQRRGRTLIKVGRFFPSSQTCSQCGHRNPRVKDLSVRKWTCPQCGTVHDRDINAAKSILREGLRLKGR